MNNATKSVDTLSEFLNLGDTDYYIFDMSRLVRQLDKEQFAALEAGRMPYPTPMQQHAWLGIAFWKKNRQDQPFIWFVRFPLDERGLLNYAARQHYLQIIIEALGRDITSEATAEQQELLKQNPYIFNPPEHKRAAFHAKVSLLMGQPPSIYYEDAEAYLNGKKDSGQWRELGVQGLHDVAARLQSQPATQQKIVSNFHAWSLEFTTAFSNVLEHHNLPTSFCSNLLALLQQAIRKGSGQDILNLMRCLASASDSTVMQKMVQELLDSPLDESVGKDILIILAARCWPVLSDATVRQRYLERLSEIAPDLFPHLFADLVALPAQRPYLLQLLQQSEQQSDTVKHALETMKKQVSGNV